MDERNLREKIEIALGAITLKSAFMDRKKPFGDSNPNSSDITTREVLWSNMVDRLMQIIAQAREDEGRKVAEEIKKVLIEWGELRSTEKIEHIKPTHGNCCTCQTCGYEHDSCVCGSNQLNEKIALLLASRYGGEDKTS